MSPHEVIHNHRSKYPQGDVRNSLRVFTGEEARVLKKLGIPTRFYYNPEAGRGLGNTPAWLITDKIKDGSLSDLKERATVVPLETPDKR